MEQKRREDSRHFAEMWKHVQLASAAAMEECDALFRDDCTLHVRSGAKAKAAVEKVYRELRDTLREECYYDKTQKNMLDGRKMGAIMCNALMKEKIFVFDEARAMELSQQKQKEYGDTPEGKLKFNRWIVNNLFINYKVAYLFSVGLVLETAKEKLLREDASLGLQWNRQGWMIAYPEEEGMDSFNVSMVLGLGKADLGEREFDMFMYALQLYQMEQYTLTALKENA